MESLMEITESLSSEQWLVLVWIVFSFSGVGSSISLSMSSPRISVITLSVVTRSTSSEAAGSETTGSTSSEAAGSEAAESEVAGSETTGSEATGSTSFRVTECLCISPGGQLEKVVLFVFIATIRQLASSADILPNLERGKMLDFCFGLATPRKGVLHLERVKRTLDRVAMLRSLCKA